MQPTNPTPDSNPEPLSENNKGVSPKTKTVKGSTVIVFVVLIIFVIFVAYEKIADWRLRQATKRLDEIHEKYLAPSRATALLLKGDKVQDKTRFKYIFDGTDTNTGGYQCEFSAFIGDIFLGTISDEILNNCMIYPRQTNHTNDAALKQVLNDYLIFECRVYPETYQFAVRRDSLCEPKFQKTLSSLGGNLDGGLLDYLPDEAIAFDGWVEFRTKGGFVRSLPAFKLVR